MGTIGNEWKTAYGDNLLIPKKITLDSLMLMKANQYWSQSTCLETVGISNYVVNHAV